jgi:hypothetical protein
VPLGLRFWIRDRVILQHEGVEMTPDVMRALAISGSILIAVVLLIIVVSFVAVRRGEGSTAEESESGHSAHR